MAPMVAASAAWNMGERDQMSEYVSRLDDGDETKLRVLGNTAASGDGSSNGTFFRAVLLVRRGKYDEAREYVERARKCLATELAALVLESYERAYSNMVRVQQLSELEEVIDYCTLPGGNPVAEGRRGIIRNMGTEWIQGAKRNVEVWQALLAVRALVLPPTEDIDTRLKFASLCRKNGRASQARSTLVKLLQVLPDLFLTARTCDGYLKDYITWKLGTLVSIVRQVLHLVEQLCLALNDEFRTHLPVILPCCIQVLSDAERCNDYTYVLDILHTLEVFGGTLDEHMHLLLPALIRLFKVDASVDIRRAAIKTLTRLIPRVQV
ncbi:hypothetical protein Patl1_37311 [Pistacia atlantica]|nr:hypothetical protein Patl1_37311 [Pistacia atlantica]